MGSNLCVKHFPEPIIYISEEPMCKKCVPEYLEKIKKSKSESGDESKNNEEVTDKLAQLFGTQQNAFTSEKSLVNNSLIKLEDFRGDFRYINDEIDDRVTESKQNLEDLPELMCQIFATCEKTMKTHKEAFLDELDDVINKQVASFRRDNETKVPNFYERLSKKYTQLQQATSLADTMTSSEIIETLN